MKNILTLTGMALFCLIFSYTTEAQSHYFKYQAVARDNSGTVLKNQNISIQITIYNDDVQSNEYVEKHQVTTGDLGIFNLNIGGGTPTFGTFGGIKFDGSKEFSIKVGMDISGGTNYTDMGTVELQSVPYAHHALTVTDKDDADADPMNEIQHLSIVGDHLSISDGNIVNLNEAGPWNVVGRDIEFTEGKAFLGNPNDLKYTSIDSQSIFITNSNGEVSNMSAQGLFTRDTMAKTFINVSSAHIGMVNEELNNNLVINPHIINMTIDSGANQLNIYGNGINMLDSSHSYQAGYSIDNLYIEQNGNEVSSRLRAGILELHRNNGNQISQMSTGAFDLLDTPNKISAHYGIDQLLIKDDALSKSAQLTTNQLTLSHSDYNSYYDSYNQVFKNYVDSIESSYANNGLRIRDLSKNDAFDISLTKNSLNFEKESPNNKDISYISSEGLSFTNFTNNKTNKSFHLNTRNFQLSDTLGRLIAFKDRLRFDHNSSERLKIGVDHLDRGYIEIMNDASKPIIQIQRGTNPDESHFKMRYGDHQRIIAQTFDDGAQIDLVTGNSPVLTLESKPSGGRLSTNHVWVDSVYADYSLRVMDNPNNPNQEIVSASVQSREVIVVCRGTNQLVNGNAVVYFPYDYAQIANGSTMTVTLTPHDSNTYGLAVINKLDDGFVIQELVSQTGNYNFDWEVKCVRKGDEGFSPLRSK